MADVHGGLLNKYLDSNFATIESLSRASKLNESKTKELDERRTILNNAKNNVSNLVKESADTLQLGKKDYERLTNLYNEIASKNDDVAAAKSSEESPSAKTTKLVRDLESLLGRLETLKTARRYLDTIDQIENQSKACTDAATANDFEKSIQGYHKLLEISKSASSLLFETKRDDGEKNERPPARKNIEIFIQQKLEAIWKELETALISRMQAILEGQMGWPKEITSLIPNNREDFKDIIAKVIKFQNARDSFTQILQHSPVRLADLSMSNSSLLSEGRSPVTLPIAYMADTLLRRFRYHFEGSHKTNQPDKPDWWITSMLNYMRQLIPFIESTAQSLIDINQIPQVSKDDSGLSPLSVDARNEFIKALLTGIRHKLSVDRSFYINNPMLIPKVAKELSRFDDTIQTMYFYDYDSILGYDEIGNVTEVKRDCLETWLGDQDLVDVWVGYEEELILSEYRELIKMDDAFESAYDQDDLNGQSKREGDNRNEDDDEYQENSDDLVSIIPTKSSLQIINMLEGIIERMEPIKDTRVVMKFVLASFFPVLRNYLEDLEIELDEFKRISLAFIKDGTVAFASTATSSLFNLTSPLISAGGSAAGVGTHTNDLVIQLQRLSSWFHSALHIEDTLKDWNETMQFVMAWADFCRWRKVQGLKTLSSSKDVNSEEYRQFSESVENGSESNVDFGDDSDDDEEEDDVLLMDGGLFDLVWTKYLEYNSGVIQLVSQTTSKEFLAWLRPYRKKNDWTPTIRLSASSHAFKDESSDKGEDSNITNKQYESRLGASSISPELARPLNEISQTLNILTKALFPSIQAEKIVGSLASDMDLFMFKQIASSHQFDQEGGYQFKRDMNVVFSVFKEAMSHLSYFSGWHAESFFPKTVGSVKVLCLPTDTERIQDESHAFGNIEDAGSEDLNQRYNLQVVTLEDLNNAIQTSSVDPVLYKNTIRTLGLEDLSLSQSDINFLVQQRVDF